MCNVDTVRSTEVGLIESRTSRASTGMETQHTVTGGSRFHLDALCNEVRRACTTPVCLGAIAASENRSLGKSKPRLRSALRVLKERGQPGGARTSSDAKEDKRSKSARFKKSSEEIGAKGLQKVLNTADTDTQEILPHRASVPRTSGPPE